MKKVTILFLAVFITSTCFADTVFVRSTVVIPDSVLVKSLNIGAVKQPFWDNLPVIVASVITGLISLIALIVAYINTKKTIKAQNENFDKQLKAQLATTIEKEWVQKVRELLADMLRNSVIMGHYKQHYGDSEGGGEDKLKQYNGAADEFQNKLILLSVYLNLNIPTEKAFYELLGELRKSAEDTHLGKVNTIIREIQLKSQELFDSKLPKIKFPDE